MAKHRSREKKKPAPKKLQTSPVHAKPGRARRPPASPRSTPLPGLEQTRNRKLDNLCEGIADERATKNKADLEENSLKQSALREMITKDITIYKHGGVELARVPGAEKLRVRLTGEQGDAEVRGGTMTQENAQVGEAPPPALAEENGDEDATQH